VVVLEDPTRVCGGEMVLAPTKRTHRPPSRSDWSTLGKLNNRHLMNAFPGKRPSIQRLAQAKMSRQRQLNSCDSDTAMWLTSCAASPR
jgi:hypothetical protein